VKNGWHSQTEPGALSVARRLPVRFDVSAVTTFPRARKGRLAHQIRQDLWRVLRDLRGFSPAVRVEDLDAGLRVTAGGRCDGAAPRAQAEERIAALLADPGKRARWLAHARLQEVA